MTKMSKENETTLTSVSDVWKDGKNLQGGVKLDLVQHLKRMNERADVEKLKQKGIDLLSLLSYDSPSVLDVGCGIGSDTLRVAKILSDSSKPARIVGIDFNTEMIAAANYFLSETAPTLNEGVSVEFQQMDATLLAFEDNSFDLVFISCTLQHITPDDVVKVLKEVLRVLKSNGSLVVIEPESSAMKFYSENKELLEQLGKVYQQLLMASSSIGSNLFWILPRVGFTITQKEAIATISEDFQSTDPGWVKLNGMARLAVTKGIFTQQEADDYVASFSTTVENRGLMCSSLAFIYKAVAP